MFHSVGTELLRIHSFSFRFVNFVILFATVYLQFRFVLRGEVNLLMNEFLQESGYLLACLLVNYDCTSNNTVLM